MPQPETDFDKEAHGGREKEGEARNTKAGAPATSHSAPHQAGVVIRASVEHVGIAGETELTVNVKWPASAFCVPPCAKSVTGDGCAQHVPSTGPSSKIRTVTGTQ